MPNAPSVKYNGFIYPDEEECQVARYEFYEAYNNKSTVPAILYSLRL